MRRTVAVVAGALAAAWAAAPAAAVERTVTLRHGPVTVGAFATERPKTIVSAPRVNGYITRMHARLVDARRRPVTVGQVMLHHVVFLNQGRFRGDREPRCGARFGEPFYGTGEENQALALPPGYGYRIRRGDRWKMQTMLMSHQPRAQRVYVEYTMRVRTRERLAPVTPHWVRVTQCRNEPSYSVPGGGAPGSVHRRTNTWVVPRSGRIVAGGAHLHGGAHGIELTQRACANRRLIASDPSYGTPDHISYRVSPVLHEPGPINTGWYTSREGIAVRAGETLDVTALYDGQWAHPGVMGVYHVYLAEGPPPAGSCAPLPADGRVTTVEGPVRDDPPHVVVPLTELDARGRPVTLAHPRGPLEIFSTPADTPVTSVRSSFDPTRLSVAAGTRLTWRFEVATPHKVSIANGPRTIGSPTLAGGATYAWTALAPGRYQLFCYLHPVTMHQELEVRAADGSVPELARTPPGGDPGALPPPATGAAS